MNGPSADAEHIDLDLKNVFLEEIGKEATICKVCSPKWWVSISHFHDHIQIMR